MKSRLVLLGAFALVVAACGGTAEVVTSQPRSTTPLTTTLVPATTSAPTTASPTTTSQAPAVVVAAPSPQLKAVRAAMAQVSAVPPTNIDGLIEVAGTDPEFGRIELSIPISSSFDPVTGDGHMLLDFSGLAGLGGEEVPPELAGVFDSIEVRQLGDTAYIKFGFFTAMLGVETDWLSMPAEDGQGFTQDLSSGVNPYDATGYLAALTTSGGEVTVVGTEELRGVATTHYRALFDLETLAELDREAFAELQGAAPFGAQDLPMDIWIDDQNRVHRFLFEIDAPNMGELNVGETFDYMRVQFDFSNYGGRVTVEPPPSADVTDISEIEDMFGSTFGDFEV